MSMSDPIADMLTRIRNGQQRGKFTIMMPSSKQKIAIANLLKEEGYIADAQVEENEGKPQLVLRLKYYRGKPVIEYLKRVSRPGLRIYRSKDELPQVWAGLGVAIVSTSKGLMTDREARKSGHGGEIIAYVA
ncbi:MULTISPECIES: 30S ribosomal protein S8 [Marichromatium]|uniref:Small ribosomal subunit protein uS8 n=1 Tax=Marichromatium gracile TaxID=1048 RepID=A0A4R4A4K5_MARGR|nr:MULTISPECIES: 30S ribosomal protein S8 [Marichromatium]MBO8084742.1 30S ribosomal protein S8 [Marichromatium sp.]KXX64984.1 30S ribosomal protein S8 [Marichromatium gracile]MBK1708639.1 30S ribosomal protein S8 [Marichromatium gracile]RNE88577.1 30S ribosomal protein S8 [Marichromatium sp. AB31]RNE93678.1 30S ribosomal protein S8 [Marichromatium sp. AB32]